MKKSPLDQAPTTTSHEDEEKKGMSTARRRTLIGSAAAGLTAIGAGAAVLFGHDSEPANTAQPAPTEASASATSTHETAPSTTVTTETPAPATEIPTITKTPSSTYEVPVGAFEKVLAKVTAETVVFETGPGDLITGTEALADKGRLHYKAGMAKADFAKSFAKTYGLYANLNTSPRAAKAYESVQGGLDGVMKNYLEQGVAAETFGSGGFEITERIAQTNQFLRDRTEATGKDYGCIYTIPEEVTKEALVTNDPYNQAEFTLHEVCGEVVDGKIAKPERTQDIWFGIIPDKDENGTLTAHDGAIIKTSN